MQFGQGSIRNDKHLPKKVSRRWRMGSPGDPMNHLPDAYPENDVIEEGIEMAR